MHELLLLPRHKVNADHIEPNLRRSIHRQLPYILPRQPTHHLALVRVHRGLGRSNVVRSSRLHFHNAQQLSLPRNQIEIARLVSRRPPPRNNRVTLAPQIEVSSILAQQTRRQVSRLNRASPRHPVSCCEPALNTIQPNSRYPVHRSHSYRRSQAAQMITVTQKGRQPNGCRPLQFGEGN